MSVAEQIQRIQGASADIKAAIESYGVTVNPTDTYAEKIGQISGGEWLPSADTVLATFARRQSGGQGPATIEKIYGKTLVWNQLVPTLSSFYATNATKTITGDVCAFTATAAGGNISVNIQNLVAGHKFLFGIDYKATSGVSVRLRLFGGYKDIYVNGTGSWATKTEIFTQNNVSANFAVWDSRGSGWDEISFRYMRLFDLTLMFGAGNEPISVDEFLALFPDALTAAYDAGALLPVKAERIKTRGVNLWDEEWEVGEVSVSGSLINDSTRIRPKNYIPVLPNTTYYFYCGHFNVGTVYLIFYANTKDAVSLGYASLYANTSSRAFTTPSNCNFIKFSFERSVGYGNIYQNDICINISNTAINGQYFPYRSSDVGLPILKHFPEGMRGVGDIYDELTPKQAIQRIGSRAYQSGDESDTSVLTDGTTTFYPLADPVVTDIDEQMTYLPDEGGTEEISPITAPFSADIRYARLLNENAE